MRTFFLVAFCLLIAPIVLIVVSARGVPPSTSPIGAAPTQAAIESLVTECARASGVDPRSNLTMQQLHDMTTCIDLVRAALARMK